MVYLRLYSNSKFYWCNSSPPRIAAPVLPPPPLLGVVSGTCPKLRPGYHIWPLESYFVGAPAMLLQGQHCSHSGLPNGAGLQGACAMDDSLPPPAASVLWENERWEFKLSSHNSLGIPEDHLKSLTRYCF